MGSAHAIMDGTAVLWIAQHGSGNPCMALPCIELLAGHEGAHWGILHGIVMLHVTSSDCRSGRALSDAGLRQGLAVPQMQGSAVKVGICSAGSTAVAGCSDVGE